MLDGPLQSIVNGVQAEHISISDRGFQYGDGCFETVRVIAGKLILWTEHRERLANACAALDLHLDLDVLQKEVSRLLAANELASAIIKIIITRGVGGRGYRPLDTIECTRVVQLFDYIPPILTLGARLCVCQHRLSTSTQLAGIKHLNRLDQVLASREIPIGFDEGICLDQAGNIVEACKSNILVVREGKVYSPSLDGSGVEGVMLNYLESELDKLGTPIKRTPIRLEQLQEAEEVYLCNSVYGVWSVAEIQSTDYRISWESRADDQGQALLRIAAATFAG